jgi:hypothetical protein
MGKTFVNMTMDREVLNPPLAPQFKP